MTFLKTALRKLNTFGFVRNYVNRVLSFRHRRRILAQLPVESIIREIFPRACVNNSEWLIGGVTNYNIRLDITDPETTLVLRVYPHSAGEKIAEKEQAVLQMVQTHLTEEVSVPNTLYVDSTYRILDKPYAVRSYLPGVPLFGCLHSFTDDQKQRLAWEMGKLLALLHSIEMPGFGDPWKKGTVLQSLEIDYFTRFFMERVHICRRKRVLPESVLSCLCSRFEQNKGVLCDRVAHFVHYDFHERNLLVTNGVQPRITGLLDFEHARAWSVEADMAKLFNQTFGKYPSLQGSFLSGYRAAGSLPEAFQVRLYLYQLLSTLSYIAYGTELSLQRFVDWNVDKLKEQLETDQVAEG